MAFLLRVRLSYAYQLTVIVLYENCSDIGVNNDIGVAGDELQISCKLLSHLIHSIIHYHHRYINLCDFTGEGQSLIDRSKVNSTCRDGVFVGEGGR